MKSGKIKFLFLISTLVLMMIIGTSAISAQEEDRSPGSGAIWTTDGTCGDSSQDINHFPRGHHVYINASGFDAGTYDWTISGNPGHSSADPGQVVASGSYEVGSAGTFCFDAYTVAADDGGVYTVDFSKKKDNYRVEEGPATVNIGVGACAWTPTGGSVRSVNLTINGAILTIDGVGDFDESQSIILPAGTYHYSWEATKWFTGSDSGTFEVQECPPASVVVDPQTCIEEEPYNQTNVILTINNATLTIRDSDNNIVDTYTSSNTITLDAGAYTYSWIADQGYSGSGIGSFTLLTCEPGKADAGVGIGGCTWEEGASWIEVNLTINNATLKINNEEYESSDTIKLNPGTYDYEWSGINGYTGGGVGQITLYGCEPASASAGIGACTWNGEESLTPVSINVYGATLKLYKSGVLYGTYGPGSYSPDLPEGYYTYEWSALENFEGEGSGVFRTVSCEPGKADAAVEPSACVYEDGQSWTTVVITISNARLTINYKEYTENAEIKLTPGDYPYSWEAISTDYEGEGEGILTVGACKPKEYYEPDVAAGGLGPSFIATAAPAVLTVSGLALTWVLIKKRIKKTN